jgi:hypothetical protein
LFFSWTFAITLSSRTEIEAGGRRVEHLESARANPQDRHRPLIQTVLLEPQRSESALEALGPGQFGPAEGRERAVPPRLGQKLPGDLHRVVAQHRDKGRLRAVAGRIEPREAVEPVRIGRREPAALQRRLLQRGAGVPLAEAEILHPGRI